MARWLKTYWIWLIIIGTVGAFAPLTGKAGKDLLRPQNIDTLAETIDLLQKQSLEPLNQHAMVHAAISGMLSTLDPHSRYLDEDEFRTTKDANRGSFLGIGVVISKYGDKIIIANIAKSSPSEKAGIQPGDIIKEIDGKPTINWTLETAIQHLKGEKGTAVPLTVERIGVPNVIHFSVLRSEVPTINALSSFMLNKTTGFILIKDFHETTPVEFERAILNLKNQGMQSLILDLRNNPGGHLEAAIDVCSQLFNFNELILTQKGRDYNNVTESRASREYSNSKLPIVVIINHDSASASEIVAGAIQDHDRGLIVGQTSWGKGLVQAIIPINRTRGLLLTTARYYTPSGRCIQRSYKNCIDDYFMPNNGSEPIQHQGPKFKTDLGRIVYSNEGITPDYVVNSNKLTTYAINLVNQINKLSLFQFTIPEKEKSSIKLQKAISHKTMERFKLWLQQQNIAIDATNWEDPKTKTSIQNWLSVEMQEVIYGPEAKLRFQCTCDQQVKLALEVMPKAEALLKQRILTLKKDTASPQVINQQPKPLMS